jgi:hypothetical protein
MIIILEDGDISYPAIFFLFAKQTTDKALDLDPGFNDPTPW